MSDRIILSEIASFMRLNNKTVDLTFKDRNAQSENLMLWLLSHRGTTDSNEFTLSYDEVFEASGSTGSLRLFELENFVSTFTDKALYDVVVYKGPNKQGSQVVAKMPLFNAIVADIDRYEVTFSFNPKVKEYYDVSTNFFVLPVESYYSKKTDYAKRLMKLLSTRRYLGKITLSIEEFNYYLNVPESYSYNKVKKRIIDKSIEELKDDFPGLAIDELRRKRKVISLTFTWDVAAQYDRKKAEITDRGTKSLDGVKLAEPAESTQFTRPTKLTQSAKSTQSLDERIDRYIELNHEKLNVAPHFDWKSARYATPDEIRAAFSENRLISFIERRVAESGLPADPHLWMSKFTEEEIESMLRNQL